MVYRLIKDIDNLPLFLKSLILNDELHFIHKEIIVIFILSTTLGVILPKSMAGMQETVDCATVNVALLVLFYFLFRQYVDLGHEEAFVDSCTNTLT